MGFSKTEHFSPVFEWFWSTNVKRMVNHSKTGPFVNWTHLDHLKTGLVRYLDGYCKNNCVPEINGRVVWVSGQFLHHVKVVLFDLAPGTQNDFSVLEYVNVVAGLK